MAIADGTATPALTHLCRVIREYTLFQAVLQVTERLREAHPLLDDDALYDQLEFQANPGLGFAAHDIDRVEFFKENGHLRARLRLNVVSRHLPSDRVATRLETSLICSTTVYIA